MDAKPNRWGWPAAVIAGSLAVSLVTVGQFHGPVRTAVGLGFVLVCPGMALVGLIRLEDRLVEIVLGVATSLAVTEAASGLLLYAGVWSTSRVLVLLVTLSVLGALAQLGIMLFAAMKSAAARAAVSSP